MKLLFVADPLHSFNPKKDSTLAMMREAQARGCAIWACEPADIHWHAGAWVQARCLPIQLRDEAKSWFEAGSPTPLALKDFDAVLMRKDPPFDAEYLYCTHLLSQAQREGALVVNDPAALRAHPEKLAIMEFSQWIAPTVVSKDMAVLREFHQTHGDVILKPLDGMGGSGIFRVKSDALNLGALLEVMTCRGQQTIMAQAFLPAIAQGDKRVLLINGEPVPYALARIPQGSEVRGNLAAGGKGVAQALSPQDLAIARALGPTLAQRGLLLVGLDIIGEHLTEINVTSPTCFREITDQTGWHVAARFIDALQTWVQHRRGC